MLAPDEIHAAVVPIAERARKHRISLMFLDASEFHVDIDTPDDALPPLPVVATIGFRDGKSAALVLLGWTREDSITRPATS
jgi:hypothetical protein